MSCRRKAARGAGLLLFLVCVPALCLAASKQTNGKPKSVRQWAEDAGLASVGVAQVGTSNHPKGEELCFKEVQRCGSYFYTNSTESLPAGFPSASGYYLSYIGCCGDHKDEYDRDEDGLMGGALKGSLGLAGDAVGSCLIDMFGSEIPDGTDMAVGSAYMSCDIYNTKKCGVETDCDDLTLSMGAGRAYAVRKAVSFVNPGTPATCSQQQNGLDGRRRKLLGAQQQMWMPTTPSAQQQPSASKVQIKLQQSSGSEAEPMRFVEPHLHYLDDERHGGYREHEGYDHYERYEATGRNEPEPTVCVGPAIFVTGSVTVSSRSGTKYQRGWLTYETFMYNQVEGPVSEVTCGIPLSTVSDLPVIHPNKYSIELEESHYA